MENGQTYGLKYQETRADSLLFLSNTYFMLGSTLWCPWTIYYFGRNLLWIENFCLGSRKLLWQTCWIFYKAWVRHSICTEASCCAFEKIGFSVKKQPPVPLTLGNGFSDVFRKSGNPCCLLSPRETELSRMNIYWEPASVCIRFDTEVGSNGGGERSEEAGVN